MKFDHFNITAPMDLLEQVKEFYCQVFDLEVGARPDFKRAGFWLYLSSNQYTKTKSAIVHLTEGTRFIDTPQQSYLNHIAFSLSGRTRFENKLNEMKIRFETSQVPDTNLAQLIFRDPVGNRLEAIFDE
ncbi:VOC family protein [Thalassotalea atypica]|uniref:VOC family protein n=1 Tax=Thalassotalea atypica TaxID=2054316 RepID=UPI002573718A|nr:VOC family protein [Thalassotalea atypica]